VKVIGILILDDDLVSQAALWQVLDSEGWQIRMVTHANHALAELASGQARLVIANIAMTGLSGPLYETLEALALSPTQEGAAPPARVLYLVPAIVATDAQPILERAGLPYLLKPYHLHELLQKVSDLLIEAGALDSPIRQVKTDFSAKPRPLIRTGTRLDARRTDMFAAREEYSMTEEEMLEWERQEEQVRKKKNRKPGEPMLD